VVYLPTLLPSAVPTSVLLRQCMPPPTGASHIGGRREGESLIIRLRFSDQRSLQAGLLSRVKDGYSSPASREAANGYASQKDITGLLLDWGSGDSAALDKLIPLVYKELRRWLIDTWPRTRREYSSDVRVDQRDIHQTC